MINNYNIVKEFMPGESLGPISNTGDFSNEGDFSENDQFLYTELLDRTKRVGNNGVRIVKTFYHRSLADFDRHMPQMLALCDALKVRAYTRLSPRSFRKVGAVFTKMVVEAALTDNFAGMKSLYTRACGTVTPSRKLWMFDVDTISDSTKAFGEYLKLAGKLLATVPSKKGLHYITPAFDVRLIEEQYRRLALTSSEISLHKDNATNLYIPDEAA